MTIEVWEKIFSTRDWGKYPSESLIRFIAKNYSDSVRKECHILEIGCGPGANIWYLAREGFSFTGIDISRSAIIYAERRLDNEIPDWRSRGTLNIVDITRHDLGINQYDAIIDNECLYCLSFKDAYLVYKKAYSALKNNGKIYVKAFADDCWGVNTGDEIERLTYNCDEGPLAGKGQSRFSTQQDIKQLLNSFSELSIEKSSYTYESTTKQITEWIASGVKHV